MLYFLLEQQLSSITNFTFSVSVRRNPPDDFQSYRILFFVRHVQRFQKMLSQIFGLDSTNTLRSPFILFAI